jgi:hypothetical protein
LGEWFIGQLLGGQQSCLDGSTSFFPVSMRVTSSQAGQVTLYLNGSLSGSSGTISFTAPGVVGIPQPLVFPFPVSAQGSMPLQSGTIVGHVNWSVDGQFNSATGFTGHTLATLDFTYQGQLISCAVGANVVATRATLP